MKYWEKIIKISKQNTVEAIKNIKTQINNRKIGEKMKKIFLLLTLLCIINLNALTMKEKIQQDLSKVGVKQEIIDETITFDRLYAMDDSDLPLDIGEIIGIFERIYEKDERNYVAAKKVLQFYGRGISYSIREDYDEKIKNTENKEEKKLYEEEGETLKKDLAIYKKYYDAFMKYNPYEHEKLLTSYEYYTIINNEKKAEEIKKIVKEKYKNTIIDKMLPNDELRDGITKYYNLGRLVEKKVNEELKFIENDTTKEKYRISDEEIYNLQLQYYMAKIWTYLYSADTKKGIEIAINELDGIKADENAKEYNFRLENGIMHWLLIISSGDKNYVKKLLSMKIEKRANKMYKWANNEEDRLREKYPELFKTEKDDGYNAEWEDEIEN